MAVKVRATVRRNNDRFQVLVVGSAVDVTNRLAQTTMNSAAQRAPVSNNTDRTRDPNTGGLGPRRSLRKGSHFIDKATVSNPKARVGNNAPHARIVHEGRGPISTPAVMKWRELSGEHAGFHSRKNVGPARAQPWIVDAYNAARNIQDLRNLRPMSRNRRAF